MTVEQALTAELAQMPQHVRDSSLAATAMVLARKMDDPDNSATSVSMCANAMLSILTKLNELAPRQTGEENPLATILSGRQKRLKAV